MNNSKENMKSGSKFLSFFLSLVIGLALGLLIYKIFFTGSSEPVSQPSLDTVNTQAVQPVSSSAPSSSFSSSQVQEEVSVSRRNAIVQAAQKVGPAVVSVGATITQTYRELRPFYDDFFDSFFRDLYPSRQYRQTIPRLGSGIIISPDGYVLTNHHVVDKGEEFFLTLSDGRQYKGELLGSDPYTDIAVLKIRENNLPYAELGDSDNLIIGEWAIAIGNPFGNVLKDPQPTVTVGVVSAVNRSFSPANEDEHIYQDMIQTDAAINPGNSGGPLVSAEGKVIGINTFIVTKSGGSLGIGFAIPINKCKLVLNDVERYGRVRAVWFGFQLREVTNRTARLLGLDKVEGFIVVYVEKKSPAWEAGLRPEDVVLAVDGVVLKNVGDVKLQLLSKRVGDNVRLTVVRDGRSQELSMILRERR
ncbi:MAG: trypsin-like peptidase domain-containing protein [Candidatus Aminicenantes bacterium]|nr:trypsin-like peptidase domain-containing protein [Candidatus Aminicenantes bacterium]